MTSDHLLIIQYFFGVIKEEESSLSIQHDAYS